MQSQELFDFTKKVYSTLPRELRDYVYEGLSDMPITILSLYMTKEKYTERYATLQLHNPGYAGANEAHGTASSFPMLEGLIIPGHVFPAFLEELAANVITTHPTSEIQFSKGFSIVFPAPRILDPYPVLWMAADVHAYQYDECRIRPMLWNFAHPELILNWSSYTTVDHRPNLGRQGFRIRYHSRYYIRRS